MARPCAKLRCVSNFSRDLLSENPQEFALTRENPATLIVYVEDDVVVY